MRNPLVKVSKAVLMTAAALITCTPPTKAATYQWDTNGAAAGLGGAATWTASNAFWDLVGTGADLGTDGTVVQALSPAAPNILQLGGLTAGTLTISGASKAAGFIFTGSDGQAISTATTAANTLTVLANGIVANSSATIGGTGAVVLGAAQTWAIDAGKTLTISAPVSGTSALTKDGPGVLELQNTNLYSGTVTLKAGTIMLATPSALQAATLSYTAAGTGALDFSNLGGTYNFKNVSFLRDVELQAVYNLSAATGTLAKVLSGIGGLSLSGGDLVVTSANTYAGRTYVGGAGTTLTVKNAAALGSVVGTTTVEGAGQLIITSPVTTGWDYVGTANSARTYTLDLAEPMVLSAVATTTYHQLYATLGVNRITGEISLQGSGSAGIAVAASTTAYNSGASVISVGSKLYLGPVSVDTVAKTVRGAGAAITGTGTGTGLRLAVGNNATDGVLIVMGDINLGAGRLTFDNGASTAAEGGVLALMGDNQGTTGGMTLWGNVYAGSPSALGRDGNVNLTGGTLRLFSDVNLGTGTFTMGSGTLSSTGRFAAAAGRAILKFDGELTPTDTTGRGTLTARKFDFTGSGTVSVVLAGGLFGADALVKSGSGAVTISGNNLFDGNVQMSGGTLTLSGANTFTGTLTVGVAAQGAAPAVAGGVLNLYGANSGVAAIVAHGVGSRLVAGAQGALGDSARGTTINLGAQLALDTQASPGQPYVAGAGGRAYDFDSAEPLTIGGQWNATTAAAKAGISASALYNLSGISRLTGDITLLGSASSAAPQVTQISAAVSSKLYIDGAVAVEAGKYADLVLRVGNVVTTPGQVSLAGMLTLGAGRLLLDGTDNANGGAVALLADNSYSGGTTIGTGNSADGTYTSVVAGAARALGTGDVTVQYGNLAVAADLDLSTATFRILQGTVWAASSIPARFASTDFDGMQANASSITALAYDLQGYSTVAASASAIHVPMHGGANGVTKTTGSMVTLSGANTFTGTTVISGGTLVAKNSLSLGSVAGGTIVSSGGTLALSGGLTIGDDLTLSGDGVSSTGALRSDAGTNVVTGTVTLGANTRIKSGVAAVDLRLTGLNPITGAGHTLTVDGVGNTEIRAAIATGTGGLIKLNAGTLTLLGNSTFTGAVSVTTTTKDVGELIVTGSLAAAPVTVGAGATFGGTGSAAGAVTMQASSTTYGTATLQVGTYGVGGLSAGRFAVGTLTFQEKGVIEMAKVEEFTAVPALTVAGNLAFGATPSSVAINLTKSTFLNGAYKLIGYGGTLTNQAALYLKGVSALSRKHYTLDFDTPGLVRLVVGGSSIRWTGEAQLGSATGTWNTTLQNWRLVGENDGVVGRFLANDEVDFDDQIAATASTTVNLAAAATAASVSFQHSVRDYTVTGAAITAGRLIKGGTGTLTLSGANSFANGSSLEGGRLRVAHNGALGSTVIELNGGSLSASDGTARVLSNPLQFRMDGAALGHATDNGQLTFNGAINLHGSDRTFTILSAVTFAGLIGDNPKVPASTVAGSGVFTKLGAGTLTITRDAAHGIAGSLVNDEPFLGYITVSEGQLSLGSGGTTGSVYSNIRNDAVVNFNRSNVFAYDAVLSGSGVVNKQGAGAMTLGGDSSGFTGSTQVQAGKLLVDGVLGGAVSVGVGATLGGRGQIMGNVAIAGIHAPGNSPGIQTIGGNLSYTSGASVAWELRENVTVNADPASPSFDQILVGGDLTISAVTPFSLSFKPTGTPASTVLWSDPFWSSSQSWVVYEVAGTVSGAANLSLTDANWQDSGNNLFQTARPGASFALAQVGDAIVLNYLTGTLAAPAILGVTLPNTHVGVPFQNGSVAVTNDALAGSEDLSATISTGNSSLLLPAGGTVTGIAAGGGIGYVSVGLATPTAAGPTSVTAAVDYTSQPSGTSVGAGVVVVAGTAYEYAVASAPANVDAGKIRRGSLAHGAFEPIPVLLRNLATDSVYGESLMATWSGVSGTALTSGTLGAALIPGQASSSLAVTVSGGSSAGICLGSAALSLTSVSVAGSNLGDTPLVPLTINVSGTVYEPAAGLVDPGDRVIDFGHIRLGSGPRTKTITVSNVAPAGVFTEVLGATFGSTEAGVLAGGTLVGIAAGVQDTTLEVGLANNLGTGAFSKQTTLTFTTSGSGLPSENIGTQVITLLGTVDALASAAASISVDGGRVHVNGLFPAVSIPVTNRTVDAFAETLTVTVQSATASLTHNDGVITGLVGNQTSGTEIQAQLSSTATPREFVETLMLAASSVSANPLLAPLDVGLITTTVSGLAYSGKSIWAGGSGDWTNGSVAADWSRWTRLGGIPGIDGILSREDTATFSGTGGNVVTLNGVSPELQGLGFLSTGGTTLRAAGAESIRLGQGVTLAQISVGGGEHRLLAPLTLHQNLEITAAAGARLNLEGLITLSGAAALGLTGSGTVNLRTTLPGNLNLTLQGASLGSEVDQVFSSVSGSSGTIVSTKTGPGPLNLSFASFEKTGSGEAANTLTLGEATDASRLAISLTAAASVQVSAGTLRNNAWIAAPVAVAAGGTLGGIGRSTAVTVGAGGTLAPGNSIGTYTTDSLTFTGGSVFNVEFNAINADATFVQVGPTALAGQIVLSYLGQGNAGEANVTAATVLPIIWTQGHTASGLFDSIIFDPAAASAYSWLTPQVRVQSDRVEVYFTEVVYSGPGSGAATDVDLGSTRIGQAFNPGDTIVSNTATIGSGAVDASLTAIGNNALVLAPAGVLGVLPAAGGVVQVSLATPTTVGPKSGQVLVSFTSQPGAVDAGSTVINVTGTAYEQASANVPGTVDLGSVRVGSALHGSFQATALPLTNLAVSATYGEKLSAAWGPTSSANVVVTGAVNALDPQASGGTLTVNLAAGLAPGDYAESATLTLTSVALLGSGLADATASQTVGIVGKVYTPAIGATVTSLDLGMTRLGTNFAAKPVAVTNQATGVNVETLKADFLPLAPGFTSAGSLTGLLAGQTASTLLLGSTDVATPGLKTGTVTLRFTTEAQAGSGLTDEVVGAPHDISVSGIVTSVASLAATAVDNGRRHVGRAFDPVAVTVSNNQANAAWVPYTESLRVDVASADAGLWHDGGVVAGLLAAASDSASIHARLDDVSVAGDFTKRLFLTGTSLSPDGILPDLDVGTHAVDVTGLVYSGKSTWGGASGVWTAGAADADWLPWTRLGGIPGIDGNWSVGDTATFAGAGANTVTLAGVSPELQALSFTSAGGTTLNASGAEVIRLGQGVDLAQMTVSGGQHRLLAPVVLHQSLELDTSAGASLAVEGSVTTPGATALTLKGAGSVDLRVALPGSLDLSLQGATLGAAVDQDFSTLQLQSGVLRSSAPGGTTVTANALVKSGAGHVVLGDQATPGRLVVAGSITFADVTAGILSNNADLRAPVTVRSGATLGGNGRSMGVTILGGGRLAPGNSIDTYTTTSLTLNATSVYEVEFNADFADQIVVTDGPTVRAGQILVKFLGSAAQQNIRGKVFTIISNAGHAATGGFAAEDVAFDAATAALFPGYTPMVNLFDDRTDLYFLFRQNFGTPRTISSVPSIMGRTHSMFLRSIIGDPCSRLAARGPSTAQGLTLNSLLGSKNDIASMVSGAVDNSWVQGYGETISANQGSGQWGYDYQLGGVAAGLDLIRRPGSVVGLAFGLSQSDSTHEYQGDRTTGTAYDLGLYAHAKHGEADFNFVAFFSKYAFNHTRQVDMEGSTKPAVGRPDAYRAGFALSYDVPVYADPESSAYLRLGFGGGVMNRSAFTETGDEAIAMRFDAVRTPYFQFDLGVGYGHDLFRSDKAWRIFGEAMLTRHLAVGQDEGVARFVTAYAGNTDTTLASPSYTYLQVRPAVGISWHKGNNSAELKVFTELRAGKSSPGASLNYRHQF